MKTKKFFMLLAAVLLMSVSAMAQSGNNEPLNGDVNGDGTVDVADMVGVIKIMKDGGGAVGEKQVYWYAGTNGGNAVTADNFTDVATKIAESEIPQTGTVTASGQYVYIVLPETRHLESLNDEGGSAVEFTCTDVMGYHIYRTVGAINTKLNYTIEETTYYWYVGQTQPTSQSSVTPQNSGTFINNNWHTINVNTTYTFNNPIYNSESNPITGDSKTNWYVALPVDKSYAIYDSDGVNDINVGNWIEQSPITVANINYKVYKKVSGSRQFAAYWIY